MGQTRKLHVWLLARQWQFLNFLSCFLDLSAFCYQPLVLSFEWRNYQRALSGEKLKHAHFCIQGATAYTLTRQIGPKGHTHTNGALKACSSYLQFSLLLLEDKQSGWKLGLKSGWKQLQLKSVVEAIGSNCNFLYTKTQLKRGWSGWNQPQLKSSWNQLQLKSGWNQPRRAFGIYIEFNLCWTSLTGPFLSAGKRVLRYSVPKCLTFP